MQAAINATDKMARIMRIFERAEQHSKLCKDPNCHLKEAFQ